MRNEIEQMIRDAIEGYATTDKTAICVAIAALAHTVDNLRDSMEQVLNDIADELEKTRNA